MSYLMESKEEGTRLAQKTDRAVVDEELALTDLAPGMRALDAGCASGVVSQAMLDRVGPDGHVTGVDLSEDRLVEARERNAGRGEFLRAEIDALPLPDGSFDYVLCRLVLEYAKDPLPMVTELARVCRPGGRVVLADIDGYGAFHHPVEGERKAAVDALAQLLVKTGFDPYVGRKLFSYARRAGLDDIRVHVRPYHVVAGTISELGLANWKYKLETLAPLGRKVLGAALYDRHTEVLVEMLKDPDVFSYSTMILVDAQRG